MVSRLWLHILVTLAVMVGRADPLLADADPLAKPRSPKALAHLLLGNKLYTLREFARAIEEYKAGALIENVPIFQYNIAQAHRLNGNHKEALWFYERFETQGQPKGALRNAIEEFKSELRLQSSKSASSNIDGIEPERVVVPKHRSPEVAPSPNSSPWYTDQVGWGLVAAGAAVGVSAGYLLVTAQGLDEDALREDQEKERSVLLADAQTHRILGGVLAGVAVVSIGSGAIRLALTPAPERNAMAIALVGRY